MTRRLSALTIVLALLGPLVSGTAAAGSWTQVDPPVLSPMVKVLATDGSTVGGISPAGTPAPGWTQPAQTEAAYRWTASFTGLVGGIKFYSSAPGQYTVVLREAGGDGRPGGVLATYSGVSASEGWHGGLFTTPMAVSDGQGYFLCFAHEFELERFAASEAAAHPAFYYQSASFTPDTTAPQTTAAFAGTAGSNGWYKSPVTMTLTATDNLTGVEGTWYKLDSGEAVRYESPVTIAAQGTTTIQFWSKDRAGNTEAANTATLKLDSVGPVITISSPVHNRTYTRTSSLLISFSATDATSGSPALSATLDGQAVANGQSIDLGALADGTHRLAVSATDTAGNTATSTAVFQVGAAASPRPGSPSSPGAALDELDRLLTESQGSLKNKGMATSLRRHILNARRHLACGRHHVMHNVMNAFCNQVKAQRGKGIAADLADRLLETARSFTGPRGTRD